MRTNASIGSGIHPNLFLSQAHRQIAGVRRQLTPRRFRRSRNFLLGGGNNLSRIFFSSGFNASCLRRAFFLGSVTNHANLDVEFRQARFNLGQLAARFFTRLLRFLHRLLDRRRSVTEHAGQEFLGSPNYDYGDDQEVNDDAQPVRLLHAKSRDPMDGLYGGRLFEFGHFVFFFSSGFAALMRQLASGPTRIGRGLNRSRFLFGRSGLLLGEERESTPKNE